MKMKKLGRTGLMVTENSFGALPIQRIDVQSAVGQTGKQVLEDLDKSLQMLQTDYVDILQLHNIKALPDAEDPEGIHQALETARKAGKCRFIGVTSHRRDVAEAAAKTGLYDTVQFPVSHVSPQEDVDLVKLCGDLDVGFIAMKGLSGGLLTNARAAYAFFQQLPNAVPIWGVQKKEELQDFLDCASQGVTMTPELQAEIEKDRKELAGNFCRGCGYCMPCREGIQINTIARLPQLLRRSPWQGYMTEEWAAEMAKVENAPTA